MIERTCDHCGATYQAKTARSRFCRDVCRAMAGKRAQRDAVVAEIAVHRAAPPQEAAEPRPAVRLVADAVRADLERADRLGTVAGAAALAMAARIDAQAETGAAVAALVRQLHATMAEATKDATAAVDPLDELRAKREARRGA